MSAPRGGIILDPAACTSCMICARECPCWCIRIGSHHETDPAPAGRRPRVRAVLDSFVLDFGLCMYCGVCIDACPYDALSWAARATPAAPGRRELAYPIAALAGTNDLPSALDQREDSVGSSRRDTPWRGTITTE